MKRFGSGRGLAGTMILVALAACARTGPPAPIVFESDPLQRGAESAPVTGQATGRLPNTVIVKRGDTYSEIAFANGVSTRALIEANGAKPPYTIFPGDVLRLPKPDTYEVVAGDSATRIARCHGVDLWSLVRMNKLQPPYVLPVGRVLRIPRQIRAPYCPESQPVTVARAEPSTESANAEPASRRPPAVVPPPALPEQDSSDADSAERSPVPPPVTSPPSGASKFLWPADGRIASGFGTKSGGLKNDGINIVAPAGSPVRATADGTVAYAGNELQAYGNLVLIKHEDGWMSAYAHNDDLRVVRGDRVRQGQTIALVGQTGNVPGPQVHFELRTQKGRPVNPLEHLGK